MKNLKLKFRNIKAHATIAALILCCAVSGAYSQSVVTPSMPDIQWYNSNYEILGINTAMISYGSTSSPSSIIASAYYDGSGMETVHVTDITTSVSATVATAYTLANIPDVILGNATGTGTYCSGCSPTTDYLMAVAYIHNHIVKIDLFDVYDNAGPIIITYLTTMSPSGSYMPQTVHLDVIADAGHTSATGFPFCDNFVVTWDDNTTGKVYAKYGSLNTGLTGSDQVIGTGTSPDVAAVQRGGFLFPPQHDFGLITYLFSSGTELAYSEWDVTTTVSTTPTTLDPSGAITSAPRIDAWDDYHYNSTSSSYAVYKVVAEAYNTTTSLDEIRTYDNYFGGPNVSSGGIDITGVTGYSVYPTSGYNFYSPTVAFGVQENFEVTHFMKPASGTDDIVFMEPINYFYSSPGGYFWVNGVTSGGMPPTTDAYTTYANAVSASANEVQPNVISVYAWAYYSSGAYYVAYKAPPYDFSFRPGAPSAVNEVTAHGWKAYPNPAASQIVVSNAAGNEAATGYGIMDMAGRMILRGALIAGQTEIDVSSLAAGTYMLQVSKGAAADGQAMFVKN